MPVRLSERRNEELVAKNHIVLHDFINFQGRAKQIVKLVNRYNLGDFESTVSECWECETRSGAREYFIFVKINNFTKNDYMRFKSE